MKHKPYTRLISAALAALVMISLLPFASCGGKATQTEKSTSADNVSQAATTPQDIQNQLAQTEEPAPPSASEQAILNLADTGTKAAELATDPLKAASDTEALKASVEDSVSQVEGTLSSTRDKLAELGLSGKQDQFEAASAKITAELSSVRQASANLKADDPASYSALSEKIDGLLASPEPATLSSDLSHLTDSTQPTPPTYGTSIAPAYLSGTPGLTPSSLPTEPGDGDLAETPDAPQSEEIVALASQLNHDPVAIYEWVRNNIDFESYYGSRKGAAGTLKEQAGNSTDTASLLIALMRASGIPARYVTGVIELTYDQACSWLATDTIEDAQALLASGGIPVTGLIEGGTLSKLQLTQTYVEAYVNYENYRGSSAGEGPSDWIPLDASYKTYEVSYPQADILSATAMGASYDSLSQEYLSSVRDESFLSFIETKIKTWLAANMPTLTLTDVMRTQSIKQEDLGLLPSDLLCKMVSAESEERELAASARWKATLTLAGTTLACDFISLSSGTLEVSFTPATPDDEALLVAYENIADIPAYLLDMVGEITAGENTVKTQAFPFGSSSSWSLAISSPGRSYQISNTLTWGAPFSASLAPTPGPVNGEIKLEIGPNFPMCLFSQAANSYISSITGDDAELASIFGLNLTKGAQEASVGISLTPRLVAGVAVSVSPNSIYIDADLSTATPVGTTKATRRDFTQASGLSGSAHEHKTLQDQFSAEAVSTSKLLALANQNAIPIVAIDRTNASAIETLTLPAYVKAQMRDQVSAGYTITTPTQPITYMDFTGEGWMVIDPATGEGAYLISGGLSGGATVEKFSMPFLNFGKEIEWVSVSMEMGSVDRPIEEYEGALSEGVYNSEIRDYSSDSATGTLWIDPSNKDAALIMGDQIYVNQKYIIKYIGEETPDTILTCNYLSTFSDKYKEAGNYYFGVDLASVPAKYNPYKDNPEENNPRIDFQLIPLTANGYNYGYNFMFDWWNETSASKNQVLSAVVVDSRGRNIRSWIENNSRTPFDLYFRQEDPLPPEAPKIWDLETHIRFQDTSSGNFCFFACRIEDYFAVNQDYIFSVEERGWHQDPKGPKCISEDYLIGMNSRYSSFEDYKYKMFLETISYTDWVFDEGNNLNISEVLNEAENISYIGNENLSAQEGIHIDTNEDWNALYENLLEPEHKMPCIGVPALCYQKGGVDMRLIMREYAFFLCRPRLDCDPISGFDDYYISLKSQNWLRYFQFCENVYSERENRKSREVTIWENSLDNYSSIHARPGDVILVWYHGWSAPDHAVLVTKVFDDGRIKEIVGASTGQFDRVVRYGMDTTYNVNTTERDGLDSNINDFFEYSSNKPVAVVGYPGDCTVEGAP